MAVDLVGTGTRLSVTGTNSPLVGTVLAINNYRYRRPVFESTSMAATAPIFQLTSSSQIGGRKKRASNFSHAHIDVLCKFDSENPVNMHQSNGLIIILIWPDNSIWSMISDGLVIEDWSMQTELERLIVSRVVGTISGLINTPIPPP